MITARPFVKLSIKSLEAVERLKKAAASYKGARYVDIVLKASECPELLDEDGEPREVNLPSVGFYLERGWAQVVTPDQSGFLRGQYGLPIMPGMTLVNPPRPFLGGTLKAEGMEWTKIFAATIKARGIEHLEDALSAVGQQAVADVKDTINNNGTREEKFPNRSPVTMEIYRQQDVYTESGRKRHRDGTGGLDREQALFKSGAMLGAINFWIRK